ncbi:MAG: hypothetical protein CMF60_07700 [Magnetococcales bacterium]|nr:hypothetical protein [Magnetococcales bacterium]|tara:strand:- start:9380 stop:11737 length:2358 start_codon:yes stop_codon:yes gene_type:complete
MDDMQEIMDDFFQEADESLDELEQDLIKLETAYDTGSYDSDLVDRIFRVLHTLKGGAGFLGLEKMASLSHAGENLLDAVRGGTVQVSTDVMDALLKTNDLLKELLDMEKAGEETANVDNSDTVAELERLTSGGAKAESAPAEKPQTEEPKKEAEEVVSEPEQEQDAALAPTVDPELLAEIEADDRLAGGDDEGSEAPAVQVNAELLAEIQADERLSGGDDSDSEEAVDLAPAINADLLAEIEADDRLAGGEDSEKDADAVADTSKPAVNAELLAEIEADDRLSGEMPDVEEQTEKVAEAEVEVLEPVKVEAKKTAEEETTITRGAKPQDDRREKVDRRQKQRRQSEVESSIRVETGKLDKTMNLVGELVLARNSLVRFLNLPEMKSVMQNAPYINEVMTNIEHLSQVTKDLQLSVLSTRMQPIKKVFDKIPRQVRDLKSKLGREVDLVIEGEFTEVDKTLVEELADPMVHLIRNSLDHGIEKPEHRQAVGKKPTGTLKVSAFYEGNKVVIQVKDDGAGIDPEKIRQIAVKKGIINEKDAEELSDDDAVKLIMAPGFSTAQEISDVSGRGVGMDVVNSSIEAIKGSVDIISEFGVGTTINISLPLTLAIVQALVVKSREEGFAIPIGDINEVIKFQQEEVHKMNDQDVIELRGDVLPLFYLSSLTSGLLPKMHAETSEVDGHVETKIVEGEATDLIEKGVAQTQSAAKASHKNGNNENSYVVVVREGKQALGVVVDDLIGQEEAVIKALSDDFEYHSSIAGATITGDGRVHMILDVPYLIKEMSKR